MDKERIAELLGPFMRPPGLAAPAVLSAEQLQSISTYVDILLHWNARINLTAVRDAEAIITRHFGESLFLAAYLFPRPQAGSGPDAPPRHALDLGSGAGFPGLPLKIYVPSLQLTLVESNRRKAAFLAEVIRALRLDHTTVFAGRLEAERLQGGASGLPEEVPVPDLVTMRAVERFEAALATAAALIRCGSAKCGAGRLALLIGAGQARRVPQLLPDFSWGMPVPVPESRERVLLVGKPAEPK